MPVVKETLDFLEQLRDDIQVWFLSSGKPPKLANMESIYNHAINTIRAVRIHRALIHRYFQFFSKTLLLNKITKRLKKINTLSRPFFHFKESYENSSK